MNKSEKNKQIFKKITSSNQKFKDDNIKTTNINILLNRVRMDKKKSLKKNIFLCSLIILVLSFLAAIFVILD